MKSTFWEAIVTIIGLIVTVAIVALIVSPKARTSDVIQAGGSAVGNNLAVAEAPVTGAATPINLSYPSSGLFSAGYGLPSFGGGLPQLY